MRGKGFFRFRKFQGSWKTFLTTKNKLVLVQKFRFVGKKFGVRGIWPWVNTKIPHIYNLFTPLIFNFHHRRTCYSRLNSYQNLGFLSKSVHSFSNSNSNSTPAFHKEGAKNLFSKKNQIMVVENVHLENRNSPTSFQWSHAHLVTHFSLFSQSDDHVIVRFSIIIKAARNLMFQIK